MLGDYKSYLSGVYRAFVTVEAYIELCSNTLCNKRISSLLMYISRRFVHSLKHCKVLILQISYSKISKKRCNDVYGVVPLVDHRIIFDLYHKTRPYS